MGHQHVYDMISQANEQDVEGGEGESNGKSNGSSGGFDPASIGARKAPDGRHYLPDSSRPGKYLMVMH